MGTQKQATQKSEFLSKDADGADVTFYTDPLCCWSWAMAPAWDRLVSEYSPRIRVTLKMGGLLPSWNHFDDAAHSISRPSQMGPEWMHAAEVSGVSINSRIWVKDPPASSYPACIAVKAVQLQSEVFAETYLQLLRRAVMVDGQNIARTGVLQDAAWQLHDLYPDFNLFEFKEDLVGAAAKEAFKKDMQEAKYLGINRFPTLVIRRQHAANTMVTGYQTYEALKSCLKLPL